MNRLVFVFSSVGTSFVESNIDAALKCDESKAIRI